jgi:hypothetical protein
MPNPEPGGPGYLSVSGIYLKPVYN